MLYDESATPEKVARMQKVAQETTSFETGVRLTGFQVSRLLFEFEFQHSLHPESLDL